MALCERSKIKAPIQIHQLVSAYQYEFNEIVIELQQFRNSPVHMKKNMDKLVYYVFVWMNAYS